MEHPLENTLELYTGDGTVKPGEKYQVLGIGTIDSIFTMQLSPIPIYGFVPYYHIFKCTGKDYEIIPEEIALSSNGSSKEKPKVKIGSIINLDREIIKKYNLTGSEYKVSDIAKDLSGKYLLSLRGREDIIVEAEETEFDVVKFEYAEFRIGDTIIGKESANKEYAITREGTQWTVIGYSRNGRIKIANRLKKYEPGKTPTGTIFLVLDRHFIRNGENELVGEENKQIKEDIINHDKKEENDKGIIKVQGSNLKIRSAVITGRIGVKSPRSKIRIGSNNSYNQTRFVSCKA